MQIILSGLIPLFVYRLRLPACMISLIRRLFLFLFFFFGLVRSGLIMLVMFCVYLFILLQLCNWYIRAYIHLSIHILYFDISDIITLFLYHSILDRVSSQKCKTRQLT